MKLKELIDRSINWGTNLHATPWQLAALFAMTVILRNLMEALSLGIVFSAPAFVLHFPVAYMYPLLALVFIMKVFSGYDAAKLLKIMVFAWTLTLLPPIIDKIAGTTSAIGYFPLNRDNAIWFFQNFFNPSVAMSGTTIGIRIEAAIGCLLAGVFTWAVAPEKRLLRGILNTVVFAPFFLIFFTWPYLIAIIFQPFFTGDGVTHSLLQWHAATESPVSGASHFITYLVDMIPVSLLALWYVREISNYNWKELKNKFNSLIPLYSSVILGTIAAFAVVPPNGLTFADAVTITGALMAGFWLVTASAWRGSFRAVASAIALTLAWASGWETMVFAGLALASGALPGPDKLRRIIFAITLFIAALSPVSFTLAAPAAVFALCAISVTVLLSKRRTAVLLLLLPLVAIVFAPPSVPENAWLRSMVRRTDSFARSGRTLLAVESASRLAAAGGSWTALAKTTHLTGQEARSRYVCETAFARGDSTTSILKVLLNMAFTRGDTAAFNNIFDIYTARADNAELNNAVTMRVTFLSMAGDTASLNYIHSRGGINPMLLRSMATAHLALGDTLSSNQFTRAFLDTPSSEPGDWARAITMGAVAGKTDWDSLYTEAEQRYGYCLPVMLARVRASVISLNQADRRDLLEKCILIRPDDLEVLETAAMWFAAAGHPDSTLLFASRAIAGQTIPSRTSFSLALNAAMELENFTETAIIARYAAHCYPGVIRHRAILAGILKARGDTLEVSLLEESFMGIQWAEFLCDSLESVVCATQD